MAKGRTVSATCLTEKDKRVLDLCEKISNILCDNIESEEMKDDFREKYGMISKSRDAGMGRGGGKLQRDALCTRGIQGKEPFSNRNLRWHPFVLASSNINHADRIDTVSINDKVLHFTINEYGNTKSVKSSEVYNLNRRYVSIPEDWKGIVSELSEWKDEDWTNNSCAITAYEACDWSDAVETYIVLGLTISAAFYKADIYKSLNDVEKLMRNQEIDSEYHFPKKGFPTDMKSLQKCPLCGLSLDDNMDKFRIKVRGGIWQAPWMASKRKEGEDSSLQIMHTEPLIESQINHVASKVRYGHRWCNIAMTDHSIIETRKFFEHVVNNGVCN